jgi:hypothetical protein
MNPYCAQTKNLLRSTWVGRLTGLALLAALLVPSTSCTSQQNSGTSPAYLIINQLLGARGDEPDEMSGNVASDVLTNGGIFADPGQVVMELALKDPGGQNTPNTPTSMNFITVTRYHVEFVRSDGRNTPGVDVPFAFDGAVTFTVNEEDGGIGNFTLVRVQAKLEAPLMALRRPSGQPAGGGVAISTIARITFYGADQAGRAVSVTGQIGVNFADWADPSGSQQ